MARGRRTPALFSPPSLLSLFSPLSLLTLLLLSAVRGQTITARGFHPAGPPDMVAAGSVIETLSVSSQGECAARAIYHNSLGFNLQRQPDADGKRSCQSTNTVTGCFSANMEQRDGWDFYFSGRQGQGERVISRSGGHTVTTYVANPAEFPAELSTTNPDYRWGVDCNGAPNTPEKQCSRYLLTGIQDDYNPVKDLDYVRCYTYGTEFRVSQEDAKVLPIALEAGVNERHCPPNQVVTALSDPNGAGFSDADWMKCNLLLSNWRVNYNDCYTKDPQSSGGGNTGWSDSWNIGTPHDQVFGVVGLWRTESMFTGFRACPLYRMA